MISRYPERNRSMFERSRETYLTLKQHTLSLSKLRWRNRNCTNRQLNICLL